MLSHSPQSDAASPDQRRLLFLDALRAFGSISIMLHHFALYPPLNDLAAPLLGACLDWLRDHARTTQIFFGVSGYVAGAQPVRRATGTCAASAPSWRSAIAGSAFPTSPRSRSCCWRIRWPADTSRRR